MPRFPTTRHSLISDIGDPRNSEAWSDFIELYEPVIYQLGRSKGLQHSDAEDITQEVLVKVSKYATSWDQDSSRGTFRGWLSVVVRNLVIQKFARTGKTAKATRIVGAEDSIELAKLQDDRPGLSAFIERKARMEAFRIAARRIRPEFGESAWQAFWKTWVDGDSTNQAAEMLGVSVGAIYVARCRVMRRLREEAQRLFGDEA